MTTDELKKSNSSISSIDKFPDRDSAFAESGLSEDFRDQFNANWEAYNPDSIQDTFWDRVSNFFGARSSADKLRMQKEQARGEEIAQLVGLQREQEYNSESAKVARMRSAGLNPDLQGLGSASEASEATEPEQRLDFSQLGTGADISKGFSNVLTTALSIYSGVQSIKALGTEIAGKEIEQAVGSEDSFFNIIKSIFKPDDLKKYLDPSSDEYGTGWSPDMKDIFVKRTLQDLGIRSARARKMLGSRVDSFMGSLSAEIKKYKSFDEWLSSQDKYAKTASSWFRPNGADSTDSEIQSALKEYANLLHSVDVGYNNFQRTYYSYLKADKIAEAQNASANFSKYVSQQKEKLYKQLVGKGDTFSLILATTLMGDNNVMSTATGIAGSVAKFL